MDFIDQIQALAARIPQKIDLLRTEEATKLALVVPFIQALGYNPSDPTEVLPEFSADVGTKKGEKVDYAIMKDGKPIILFECKKAGASLDEQDSYYDQLYRYFSVTDARFGIITNGVEHRFYSDLDKPNQMDSKPFLEFSLYEINDSVVQQMKRFTKSAFDVDQNLLAATELKYVKEIKRILGQQLTDPSEDFVRLVASRVYTGRMTQSVMQRFHQLTKQAFHQFINERINYTLKSALAKDDGSNEESHILNGYDNRDIITTEEEIEAYLIIKAFLRQTVDVKRITIRDAKSYCAILLDDTNRKPLCRLWFNGSNKFISLFDEDRKGQRLSIERIDDLYNYADRLIATAKFYIDSGHRQADFDSEDASVNEAPISSPSTESIHLPSNAPQ